jgi:tetratricopeptide (TPR) repeat protein
MRVPRASFPRPPSPIPHPRLSLFALAAATLLAQPAPNRYVDPGLCATCHSAIAATYRDTGMGRSFHRAGPADRAQALPFAKPFYHAASDTYFVMLQRSGKLYQRRWQIGFDGRETNVDEKQADFIAGSGNHSRTYLHLTARGTLQELPLSWYSEKGGYWAMSPGFDRPDYPGSTRLVTYECIFCHNAYPAIPAGRDEPGAAPEFLQPLPEGIDCQRCHGPGLRHVQAASRAAATAAEIRAAIVNPRRLPPDREFEICLQCHLETTTVALPHEIRRFERGPFSYIPGQPLADFHLTFDRAAGMGETFEVASAPYRLRESQCFLKSQGKLRCTTCHDPHNIPRGQAAAAHYNGVCGDCHRSTLQRSVAAGTHTAAVNCIDCHMPKRRTDDAVHIVMTDHLIRRRPPAGDLLAEKPELRESPAKRYRGEVVPYYPARLPVTDPQSALYIAVAQVREQSNLEAGLPLLESLLGKYHPSQAGFYLDLAEAFSAAREPSKAVPYLEQAARLAPQSAVVLRKLGSAQMEAGQLAAAEATLRRATAFAPRDAAAWGILGQVLSRQSRGPDAIVAFRQAIAADPELPEFHSALAPLLLAAGDVAAAGPEFREALRLQPGSAQAQANLASFLASRNQFAEARNHFERSLQLKPDDADARLNYARMLAGLGQTDEAEKQVRAAVEADPQMAGAHQLWGALLAARGDTEGSIRELETAVRLQPDFGRAQFELGVVLGRKGDFAASLEHLKIAAQSSDPDAKASALDLLHKLGK